MSISSVLISRIVTSPFDETFSLFQIFILDLILQILLKIIKKIAHCSFLLYAFPSLSLSWNLKSKNYTKKPKIQQFLPPLFIPLPNFAKLYTPKIPPLPFPNFYLGAKIIAKAATIATNTTIGTTISTIKALNFFLLKGNMWEK